MNIVIIEYNAGNIFSVDYALKRIGVRSIISGDPSVIRSADKVIFPGVGEASTTMNYLRNQHLDNIICNLKQPVLGICIGMQLLCKHSDEGNTPCLSVFEESVSKFQPMANEKIPHMGWNTIQVSDSPLFVGLPVDPYVYFVHSYRAEIGVDTIASTNYAGSFSSALNRDNFFAVQFHPEKSGEIGSQILTNFINL